ncbi:unnamed protein product [Sphagnum jensenii]|uniref:Uncharacterized protein n=1 Tax=Sphagnum jensenii TaxID=128206 RepID=A0ABP1AR50_9BRYO
MGQGQSGGLPSKQGGTWDRKGDPNNKNEKKYEPAASPTRVGKKQRKQKGPKIAARLLVVHACHQVQCRNPSLGSRPRQGGCKGVGQKEARESHQDSRECKKV